MKKRGPIDIGMILFMLMVFALIFVLFRIRPTSHTTDNDTSTNETPPTNMPDFKVYTNSQYKFSFLYSRDWTFFTDKASENPLTIEFAPVPEGTSPLKTFYGELRVYENIPDFNAWLTKNRNFTAEDKINQVLLDVNKIYGPGYLTKEHITFFEDTSELQGKPMHILNRTVRCPDNDECSAGEKPIGFTKWVDIYHNNNVVEFYVSAHFESANVVELNNILTSLDFD